MSGLLFDQLPVKTWWLPRELVSLMYPEIFYVSITADPIRLGIQSASCFWGQRLGNIFAIVLHLLLLADLAILSHTCFTFFISLLNTHTSKIHCAHLIPSVAVYLRFTHTGTGKGDKITLRGLSRLSIPQMDPFDLERKRIIWFLTESVLLWSDIPA